MPGSSNLPASILFVQKRPIRAGAQTSLARMVESTPLRELAPVVLVGGHGWLEEQLQRQQVPVAVTRFVSPRGFAGRLFGLGSFASRVACQLERRSIHPTAIIANDHQECPLALALAKALGHVPVLGILRTPGMTRMDFDKYDCDRCDGLMGEGKELRDRLTKWANKPVALFEEGFMESEFMPLKPIPASCPRRVLVAGSEAPRKGFTDFIEAVHRMEARLPDFGGFECDLTGAPPSGSQALLAKPSRSSFKFLGRVEGFANLVRQYDLAVHPSRAETFGMAPIEAMLAGTPTLVSTTGVVAELDLPTAWTFPPGDIATLTDRLVALWQHWPQLGLDLSEVRAQIRRRYHIDHTAGFVRRELEELGIH
ncbi:MAG TPA: glycosyltransferase [Prosthecobacter sp.]|nr:glycosyltransferase [Prosthecobacter sp.]